MTTARPYRITDRELRLIDAWWRAANYLSVGQIYLLDNPLLREPLQARARQAAAARPLGHDARAEPHLRPHQPRRSSARDLDAIYIIGPGPRRPGDRRQRLPRGHVHARSTRRSPRDEDGMRRLFRQFSFPGGIPSHVAPETPGLDPRGRRAGLRALARATARRSTTRTCSSCCVVGDGEAETGPLAASWHSNKFLDPVRDGAVLPILHLNGYKIANPTVLARIPTDELRALLEGYGYQPYVVEGDDPAAVHQQMAATLDAVARRDRRDPAARARATGDRSGPRWPMIVLRTPKGWTGPKEVDGMPVEGTWRSHQVPLAERPRRTPSTSPILEAWLRSYRPEELFDDARHAARRARARSRPRATRRMSANPRANGGDAAARPRLPDFRDYAVDVPSARATTVSEATRVLGKLAARRHPPQPDDVPPVRARRDRLEPAGRRLRGHRPGLDGRDARRSTSTSRRDGPRHGGPVASTCARAGWRATC